MKHLKFFSSRMGYATHTPPIRLKMRSILLVLGLLLGSLNVWGAEVEKTMNTIVNDNSYTVSSGNTAKCYTSFSLDANITVSTSGSANCGSFWGTTTKDWRLYQNKSGNVTITAASGYDISKITITYNVSNSGTLKDGSTTIASGVDQSVSGSSKTYTVGNTGNATNGQVKITKIKVVYAATGGTPTCENPSFSPVAGAVASGTNVSISSTTEGATIYYTTDGSTPTTSSATSQPIEITAATTIKAIAVKDGYDNSDVATAAYTIVTPKTIAQIMPTSETEGDAFLLNDVTVTYVSGTNIYVKDASGYILVYDKNSAITGAANGKVLQGLQGKAKLYKGLPEISTVTQAPTVIDGSAVVPEELNAYPTDADLNKYVTLEGVTFASAATLSGSVTNIDGTFKETTLILRNQFKLNGVSVATGKSYRVVGVVQKYNETYQVYPITITEIVEAGAPEAPTFSVAAGTYTSVQSVELSCATEGATIYYTTDGATPTTESTVYSSAIEVGADMTIKAIAIKDAKSSAVAEAAYVINLPEDENVRKTWDLSIASYSANSENKVTWSATYVSMVADKYNSTTAANNYLGGDANNRTSSRFYKDSKLTITPSGKQISTIVFTATSESYATALANSTWTNATAEATGSVVTVTAAGTGAVSAVVGGTCGFTAVQVNYGPIDTSVPDAPTFSPAAGTYTEVQNVTITCATEGATIYYTTDGATPDNTSTEYTSAISVGENMTIKAIAIKDTKSSSVAEAAYVINLPEDENVRKTWDLSIDETASASTTELTWTATYVSMSFAKGTGSTNANNYYPGTEGKSYTSTRAYTNGVITITPSGKQISTIVFTATSDAYATALAGSTWTNATAEATGSVVTVTAAGTGAVSAAVGGTCGFTAVQVNYGPIDPSTPDVPTFSVAAGTYTAVQTVEISCATAGATIYYTTDGSTPDNTSTEYTGAITVDATMTIKAIAVKETKSSSVATAAYTINLPIVLTTMDAIFAKATEFGNTLTEVQITFDNWVVSGISTDDKNIYVTDGTKGLVIYDKDALKGGFEVNDKLNGTVTCNLKLYKGFSDIDGLKANAAGLTVTKDGTVVPVAATIAELGAVNTGAPIILSNVKYDGSVLTDGTNNITPYTTFFADAVTSLEENKYYNITGIYVHFNTTKEVAPRSAADIEEIVDAEAPEMKWYVDNTKATEITTSYTINLGDAFAPYFETNSTGALTYSSSNSAVATIDPSTGVLALTGTTGSTEISCAVAADATYLADSKSFTLNVRNVTIDNVVILAQYDGKWYAMKSAVASSKAEGIEVNYSDSKIYDLAPADQDAITWKRTTDSEGNVTFQNLSNDQYLKTSSNDLKMEAGETGNYQWTLSEGYYHTGTQTRTFIYRAGTVNAFKSYAVSNAGDGTGTTEYSALPVVTAAVFATTPVEPVYETVRENLEPNRYYTVCLPKKVIAIKGASFWTLKSKSQDGATAYLEEETNNLPFAAGKPFIIQATAAKLEVVYEGAATEDAGTNGALHGTLVYMNAAALAAAGGSNVYMLFSNELRPVGENNHLEANRAYVRYDELNVGTPASIPGRRVKAMPMAPQVATGVEDVQGDNVQCTKVLINGQLFILHGEKMYNANGQLVK